MGFRKLSKCFTLLLCLILVTLHVLSAEITSLNYQRRTELEYRRDVTSASVPVHSLSACAVKCTENVQCVSFFFNIVDFLCQTEGRILLSFDGSKAGSWQYYEMKTVNVAFNKTASMSTIYYNGPSFVVDGIVVLHSHPAGLCSHTRDETTPWIKIDLDAIYVIKYVTLFNRIDAVGHRLHDVFVTLGDTNAHFPTECGQFQGPGVDAEMVHVICPKNTSGRFVKTEIRGSTPYNVVVLCEIRVLIS